MIATVAYTRRMSANRIILIDLHKRLIRALIVERVSYTQQYTRVLPVPGPPDTAAYGIRFEDSLYAMYIQAGCFRI